MLIFPTDLPCLDRISRRNKGLFAIKTSPSFSLIIGNTHLYPTYGFHIVYPLIRENSFIHQAGKIGQ
jgi:hypothetical protein